MMQKIHLADLVHTKKQSQTGNTFFSSFGIIKNIKPSNFSSIVGIACVSILLSACTGKSASLVTENGTIQPTQPQQINIQFNERLVFLQAETAFQRGNFDVAFQKFQLLATSRPDDINIMRRLLQIASRNGQVNDVQNYAQKVTQIDPKDTDAWLSLAEISLFKRDYLGLHAACVQILTLQAEHPNQATEQVLNVLRQGQADQQTKIADEMAALSDQFRDNHELLLADGRLRQENGDYRQSQHRAQQILQRAPTYLEAHRLLVSSLAHQGQLPQADTAFDRLLTSFEANQIQNGSNVVQNLDGLDVLSQNLRLGYVAVLIDAAQFNHAKSQLQLLLKNNPKNTQALRALGLLHLQTNDYAKAEQILFKLSADPKEADVAWYYLGNSAYEQAQYTKAIEYYGKVHSGEYLLDSRTRMAYAYGKQHMTEQGAALLTQTRAEFPEHYVDVVTSLSDFWRDFGRMDQAFEVLNQAITDNDSDGLRYSRAILHEKSQNMPAAQADLRVILTRNSDHFSALNALGYLLSNSDPKYYAEAEQLIERALRLNPDDAAILDSRGWIDYRLGRLESAVFYLRRAYKKASLPEIAAHLGEVLYQMGETGEAKKILVEASERDSKNPSPDPTLSDAVHRFIK